MSHSGAKDWHARGRLQACLLLLAAATIACQSLFVDSPTPVKPRPRSSQPATASPAPGTPSAVPITPTVLLLATQTPGVPPATVTVAPPLGANYQSQSGDTLAALALRFRTDAATIALANPGLPQTQTIAPGTWLNLPTDGIPADAFATRLLPDSQVIFTSAALGFDVRAFVLSQPGFLASYTEVLTNTQPAQAGWQIVAFTYSAGAH